jgi:hypothetical protein
MEVYCQAQKGSVVVGEHFPFSAVVAVVAVAVTFAVAFVVTVVVDGYIATVAVFVVVPALKESQKPVVVVKAVLEVKGKLPREEMHFLVVAVWASWVIQHCSLWKES